MEELNLDPVLIERAKARRGGRLNAYETVIPAKTALVVVDMQHYFVTEGMPSYAKRAAEVAPNINRLAVAMRAAGGLVVWIQTEAPPDPDDWANRAEATAPDKWASRQELLAKDGAGFPIAPECEVAPEDHVAIKLRYSAFIPYPSELSELLEAKGIDTLLITGVSTSTCCESTARDASMWGYRTIMVEDGNADVSEALHKNTLGKFLIAFGDVQTTDQLIARLGRKTGAANAAE
jgi:ureidoacrylate peracid hydrolase